MSEMSKEVEIEGFRYQIHHADPEEAWDIGVELLKLIGGSAAQMASAAGSVERVGDALSSAVNQLLGRVDGKASMALMKRIMRHVEVQGKVGGDNKRLLLDSTGIKTHFHGRVGAMMKLCSEAIAFTHEDFFEAISDGVASLMRKVADKTSE